MATQTTQVQRRRGTAAQYVSSGFVGAKGEFTYDETAKTIRVHDGETAGGFKLVREAATTPTAGDAIKVHVTSQGLIDEIKTLQWSDLESALTSHVVMANDAISGATKCKVTYDSKGLVVSGSDLSESDIPTLSISKVAGLQSALDNKSPLITVVSGATSGTINLEDNKITKVVPTSNIVLVPPTVTNTGVLHQLMVQLDNRAEVSVTLSNVQVSFGANTSVPGTTDLKGVFNIYYEYDFNLNGWVVGVVEKSLPA